MIELPFKYIKVFMVISKKKAFVARDEAQYFFQALGFNLPSLLVLPSLGKAFLNFYWSFNISKRTKLHGKHCFDSYPPFPENFKSAPEKDASVSPFVPSQISQRQLNHALGFMAAFNIFFTVVPKS